MLRYASFLLAAVLATSASAQIKCSEGLEPIDHQADARMTAMDFIHNVPANEVLFARAYPNFGYRFEISVQTLQDQTVDGEYRRVSTVDFDPSGARRVTVNEGPTDTLTRITLPSGDFESLRDGFAITPEVMADRDIVYSGRQKFPDFNSAVFDIVPRNDIAAERGFSGRVWVRQRDSAIARSCGRAFGGPFGPMRYLAVREKVADKYYFPTLIKADEAVRSGGQEVHVRVSLKYSDYKAR
jgi:hypothetical protein